MATKTVTRTTCDRCNRIMEEIGATALVNSATGTPLLYLEGRGEDTIKFDDLCDKCVVRVKHLVNQLRLEKEDGVEKEDGDEKPEQEDSSSKKPSKNKGKDTKPSDSQSTAPPA